MRFKKLGIMTCAVLLIFLGVALFSNVQAQETTITLTVVYEAGSAPVLACEKFADLVEEKSDGEIVVNVFAGGVLGSGRDDFDSVSTGSIEMLMGGATGIDMYAPEYGFVEASFVIDWERYDAIWRGELGEELRDTMEEANLKALGGGNNMMHRGARQTTTNRPIESPEDLEGLNIRLPEVDAWVPVWQELGASPVTISLDELYGALQTGVVDASEGPLEQIYTFSLFEVQDYLILTEHNMGATGLWINLPFFEELDTNEQEILEEAAKEAMEWGTEFANQENEELIDRLEEEGMTVIRPERDPFVDKAYPALEHLFDEYWGAASLEDVLEY